MFLNVNMLQNKIVGYQACSKCILDTNDDSEIYFDERGICNYCKEYEVINSKNRLEDSVFKEEELKILVDKIKSRGHKNKYDCVIGVSGGVDSTYLIYKATELGLRPLIVHYDNGWDSELAVINIENIVKKLDLDLITYVNDWHEFKDIQLAFLKASVLDIELITDQAILAVLYNTAIQYKIKYISRKNLILIL